MTEGRYQGSDEGSKAGTAITFLLIGLGAGALLGFLYAPKVGKQMRKELRRRFEDAREGFEDWKDEAQNLAEEVVERTSEIAEEIKERVAPMARNIRRR